MAPEVKRERTGWRDQWISTKHRLWGWDCPWQDIDWLEYDDGHPIALFEYKEDSAPSLDSTHKGALALIELGDRAGLPVFGVRYRKNAARFSVTGLNRLGRLWALNGWLNEESYVEFLYALRRRDFPQEIRAKIRVGKDD